MKAQFISFGKSLVTWGGHHISTAAIFLGAATISAMASLFSDDIKSSEPFVSCLSGACSGISMPATIFWVVTCIILPLAILQAVALYNERRDSTATLKQSASSLGMVDTKLVAGVDKLQEMIRTMPPRHFIAHLSLKVNQAFKFRDDLLFSAEDGTIEDQHIEFAIRNVLGQVLWLAQYWDTHSVEPVDDVVYRGNIMLFSESNLFGTDEELNALFEKLRFADTEAMVKAKTAQMFDGYLEVAPELSTHTASKESEQDSSVKPLALAVNFKKSSGEKSKGLMPGAPKAMFYQRPQWIDDTSSIASQCERDPYLAPWIKDIREYFEKDNNAASILSIPLPTFSWHQANGAGDYPNKEDCIGVLNIYRNKVNIVHDQERSEQFTNLVSPFCLVLTELTGLYLMARKH